METWPSIKLDQQALDDMNEVFELSQVGGYTHVVIWGLLSARRWAPNLPDTADAERRRNVDGLLRAAHERGLKVLYGVGLYSWGFEAIIEHDPRVDGGHPITMCGSRQRSHEWMEKVLRYVLTEVDVDGVAMQSSDQGRCPCDLCSEMSSLEYHAMVNSRSTAFIKASFPDKFVYVNTWGMDLSDPGDLTHVQKMAEGADVLIDYNNSSARRDPTYRARIAETVKAAFGTLQGWWFDPPPFWDRFRYFMPLTVRNVPYHQGLLADGARAIERYILPLNNPAARVSFLFDGFMTQNPTLDPETALRKALEIVYAPKTAGARQALIDIHRSVEDSFLANSRHGSAPQEIYSTRLHYVTRNPDHPAVDRPQYLMRLKLPNLEAYGETVRKAHLTLRQTRHEIGARGDDLERCLLNVLSDVELTRAYHSEG